MPMTFDAPPPPKVCEAELRYGPVLEWRSAFAAEPHGTISLLFDAKDGRVVRLRLELKNAQRMATALRTEAHVGDALRIVVETIDGELLWERAAGQGMTSAAYREDGTLVAIVAALEGALSQARGELGADYLHPVTDVGAAAAEIERDVPGAVVRHGNSGR